MRQFDGDLTKWSTFWDSFESSIHNSRELSCVYKFNYLNSLLEGPAFYTEAVAILKKRFGNHMEILLNVDAVNSQ